MAFNAKLTESTYANKDKHVDTSIGGNNFTNASRVIIYAAIHGDANTTFKPIGVIQGWSSTEQRQMEELFELGSDIRYLIPGRTTGQLAITRMLINGMDLVNTLYGANASAGDSVNGQFVIKSIKDINKAIDLMFVSYYNAQEGSSNKVHMVRYFDNCWIVARQESITANQVVIAENCTLSYEKIAQLKITIGESGFEISSDQDLA
jgi:hypothetical protein